MPSSNQLTISVFYYDVEAAPSNQPREIAERCRAEIILLSEQLAIIGEQLSKALTQKEIEDVVRLCHFHYENLLFRIYALRERAWDVLAALTDTQRRTTGNERFRADVLSKVQATDSGLSNAFHSILNLIDTDVRLRNVATHKTILALGLMREGVQDIWEFDSVLWAVDPRTKDGIRIRELVRRSLREFVGQQRQHIQNLFDAAVAFSRECDSAIRKKRW
jgi:hypothetical protein